MCCGNKKKVVTSQVNQPNAVSGIQNPSAVKPTGINNVIVAPSSVPVIPSGNSLAANNQMGVSKLIDKRLQKSQVRVQQVSDPKVVNFFKDCRTQRIDLTKVTNQHASYVRQSDYFDLSSGHQAQLAKIGNLPDTRGAMYGTSDSSTLSTPSIHKFYYDRDLVDVGYTSTNAAYKPQYVRQGSQNVQTGYHDGTPFSGNTYSTVQPMYGNQNSTVQPVYVNQNSTVQPVYVNQNSTVQPVYTNQNSTVQPLSINSGVPRQSNQTSGVYVGGTGYNETL